MPASGFLNVRVFASNAQLPIAGATVSITQAAQTGTRLLAVRLTDESGRISTVRIDTPEKSESLSPGLPIPFTSVDVTVDHPDYTRALLENVQIFTGIVTQQNVELIPLSARPDVHNMTDVVNTTAQGL